MLLTRRPPDPDSGGVIALVMAFDGNPANIRLLGLGADFGRAVAVVPIASDGSLSAYRGLEHIIVNRTEWEPVIAPIEAVVKGAGLWELRDGIAGRKPASPYRVGGEELDPSADVPESEVLAEVYRVRARFPLGARPDIAYGGHLIRRDGRVDGFCCPICLRELDPGCVTHGHSQQVVDIPWTVVACARDVLPRIERASEWTPQVQDRSSWLAD